jgi:hypothetical protein
MSKEQNNQEENKALHIGSVMGSFKLKLQQMLAHIEEEQTWDEWQDGVKFGREDMLEDLIQIIDRDYLNCP